MHLGSNQGSGMLPPGGHMGFCILLGHLGEVKGLGFFGLPWMDLGGGVARQGVIRVPPCIGHPHVLCSLRAPFTGTQGGPLRSPGSSGQV